jgi:hypothetical protein
MGWCERGGERKEGGGKGHQMGGSALLPPTLATALP